MGLFSKYIQSLTTSQNQHCYLPSFKTPSTFAWVMLMPSSYTSSSSEFFIITVISCPLHKNFQWLPFPLGLNAKMYDDLQGSYFSDLLSDTPSRSLFLPNQTGLGGWLPQGLCTRFSEIHTVYSFTIFKSLHKSHLFYEATLYKMEAQPQVLPWYPQFPIIGLIFLQHLPFFKILYSLFIMIITYYLSSPIRIYAVLDRNFFVQESGIQYIINTQQIID